MSHTVIRKYKETTNNNSKTVPHDKTKQNKQNKVWDTLVVNNRRGQTVYDSVWDFFEKFVLIPSLGHKFLEYPES